MGSIMATGKRAAEIVEVEASFEMVAALDYWIHCSLKSVVDGDLIAAAATKHCC